MTSSAQPVVVALCGLPGSGKSTLARLLVNATGWTRLDRDELRLELFSKGGYSDEDKEYLGGVLRERMADAISKGESLILDGMTLSRANERDAFREIVESRGARWLLVWLDCETELARARVNFDRRHPAVDRNMTLVDRVAERFEFPDDAFRLDARQAPTLSCRQVLKELDVV